MRRFIPKFLRNRGLWTAVLVTAVLIMLVPNMTIAQALDGKTAAEAARESVFSLFKLDDVSNLFVSGLIFMLTWFLSLLAGVVIMIQAWWLQIILSISLGLVNSAPVKIGFPIVLSIANLFFVGALIAIAIATILRREEYGMKKVLWKLVVMAVMVNFGLVICGSLLALSDETTKFFVESVSPGSIGADGKPNFYKFASSIAGAFNPSGVILSTDDVTANPALAKESLDIWSVAGDSFGKRLKPVISILFALGSFVIIIITLATLNLMLLWRYIRLGMALIVLPLAWAAWIFPAYQEHYKKWWTKFTQWAIFPPVVVFFIWIALKTSEVMSDKNGEYAPLFESMSDNPASNFLGNIFAPVISQALKTFILFGIMMGGIVAAQELGIKFADSGYKAVEGVSGWAKAKAGRVADARIRNIGKKYNPQTKETSTAWQRLGSKLQAVPVLRKVPGFQAVGQYIAEQGNTSKRYDENIEKERKKLEGLTDQGLLDAARVSSIDPAVQAAKAQELARRKILNPNQIGEGGSKTGGGDIASGNKILEKLVQVAEKMGNDQSLYNVRPDLVKYSKKVAEEIAAGTASDAAVKAAITEVVKKIPTSEANKISHPSLGSQNPNDAVGFETIATFLNLGIGHFAKIGSEGSFEQQQAVLNTFKNLDANRGGLTDPEKKQLDRVKNHLRENANWASTP